MKIAIDKDTYGKIKINKNNEYVYLFDNEKLEDLLILNMHCLYYKKCDYIDINATKYNIDCLKKANINDKDWGLTKNVLEALVNNSLKRKIENQKEGLEF